MAEVIETETGTLEIPADMTPAAVEEILMPKCKQMCQNHVFRPNFTKIRIFSSLETQTFRFR